MVIRFWAFRHGTSDNRDSIVRAVLWGCCFFCFCEIYLNFVFISCYVSIQKLGTSHIPWLNGTTKFSRRAIICEISFEAFMVTECKWVLSGDQPYYNGNETQHFTERLFFYHKTQHGFRNIGSLHSHTSDRPRRLHCINCNILHYTGT